MRSFYKPTKEIWAQCLGTHTDTTVQSKSGYGTDHHISALAAM